MLRDWEEEAAQNFDSPEQWEKVKEILAWLRTYGIYYYDASQPTFNLNDGLLRISRGLNGAATTEPSTEGCAWSAKSSDFGPWEMVWFAFSRQTSSPTDGNSRRWETDSLSLAAARLRHHFCS